MTEHKYWTDEAKRERVSCPVCQRKFAARRDGKVCTHRASTGNGQQCPGGNEWPLEQRS